MPSKLEHHAEQLSATVPGARVQPEVLAAMLEVGIDLGDERCEVLRLGAQCTYFAGLATNASRQRSEQKW